MFWRKKKDERSDIDDIRDRIRREYEREIIPWWLRLLIGDDLDNTWAHAARGTIYGLILVIFLVQTGIQKYVIPEVWIPAGVMMLIFGLSPHDKR